MNTIPHHAAIEISDINARPDLSYWQKQERIEIAVEQAILKHEQTKATLPPQEQLRKE